MKLLEMFYNLLYRLGVNENHDKYAHAIVGFGIVFTIGFLSLEYAILIGAIAGVLKEVRDEIRYGGFDKLDLVATLGGVGLGWLVHVMKLSYLTYIIPGLISIFVLYVKYRTKKEIVHTIKMPFFIRWYMGVLGVDAVPTIWNTIYYKNEMVMEDPALIKHELKHIEQMDRDGRFTYMIKYNYYQIIHGYENNPYEIEARQTD